MYTTLYYTLFLNKNNFIRSTSLGLRVIYNRKKLPYHPPPPPPLITLIRSQLASEQLSLRSRLWFLYKKHALSIFITSCFPLTVAVRISHVKSPLPPLYFSYWCHAVMWVGVCVCVCVCVRACVSE